MSQFSLFRETVSFDEPNLCQVVNVASVPQRSPFRYPGGKTWLIPIFRRWLASLDFKPEYLIEPFAGGGTIGLTALCEGLTKKVLLVELDKEIAAVWRTLVAGDGEWLASRILSFELTLDNVQSELNVKRRSTKELAFQTILKNRTYHGGILAEGSGLLKHGENGKGIASRWYPQTLAKRIRNLSLVRHRLDFIEGDGFEVLKEFEKMKDAIFFIDPPYTAGGKKAGSRLYNHSEIDHPQLFKACSQLKGNFLLTYDNAEEVKALARQFSFEMKPVGMKNTHHANLTELLVSRNMDWLDDRPRIQETSPSYRKIRVAEPRQRKPALIQR